MWEFDKKEESEEAEDFKETKDVESSAVLKRLQEEEGSDFRKESRPLGKKKPY